VIERASEEGRDGCDKEAAGCADGSEQKWRDAGSKAQVLRSGCLSSLPLWSLSPRSLPAHCNTRSFLNFTNLFVLLFTVNFVFRLKIRYLVCSLP
jgi:hypothetical protein